MPNVLQLVRDGAEMQTQVAHLGSTLRSLPRDSAGCGLYRDSHSQSLGMGTWDGATDPI